MPKKPCRDHLGREWPSEPEMCGHYGIAPSTYYGRRKRGWTVEQALSVPADGTGPKINPGRGRSVEDHLGNRYPSVAAMCRHWGIDRTVYWSRLRVCGWPLERILTEPVREPEDCAANIPVTDHLGHAHPSISAMCRAWNIRRSTYNERRKRGWDIGAALTEGMKIRAEGKKKPCRDHLGKRYESESAMCRAYGITRYCYSSRVNAGWTKKKALTSPMVVNARPCEDHAGRRFPTVKDMANFLGLPGHAFQGRKITDGMVERLCAGAWTDRDCAGWHVTACAGFPWFTGFYKGRPAVAHFETLLAAYHGSPEFVPIRDTGAPHKRIRISRLVQWPWYLCELDGRPAVLDYWKIINIHAESNFGL